MPLVDIPTFGTIVLCLVLVAAAYTFMLGLAAGRGRPRLLVASRYGAYATVALIALAVFLLAYAFQTHDFRIRYVARYSDRSMPAIYLWTALWGGQDGSLLWWTFVLACYTGVCVRWMRGRYLELQPYVLATLMGIVIFFACVMLFAANPFAITYAGVPADGEGLNPLLQNYWMPIHPPSLYAGFVGWSIPFAFVIAALVTGRLREEWIYATRKWVLVAWGFLAIGNLLGALWSYEELGWGGYWAWDPVENAAFMPLLVGTAFLHSVMIQERRGMLKVWNVFLLCTTFILTIFGTFLTRSGLIASVHSFARSDIGIYFIYFLVFLIVLCAGLIVYRLPKLRAENKMDSLVSREFAFMLNNWILLGMLLFILIATTFPRISEWLRGETVTVGPPFYNRWMVPLGLILLFLAGVGPLIAWRKATGRNLMRALMTPTIAALVALVLHIAIGPLLGFPPYVRSEEIYDTVTGRVLAAILGVMPAAAFALCTFVLFAVGQEFWRGTAMRMKNAREPLHVAFVRLVAKAKRRYGGYIVHIGIVSMFFGFMGAAYDHEKEAALRPGDTVTVDRYVVRYDRPRQDADENKRMIFADLTVLSPDGDTVTRMAPAKYVYRTHPEMPTTEVSILSTPRDDLYVVMNSINPDTNVGTFKVIVRPFVVWIWIGGLILLLGTFIAAVPSLRELLGDVRQLAPARATAGAAAMLLACALAAGAVWLGTARPAHAQSNASSSLHAGSVNIRDPRERKIFERLLCTCGDCQRLPLSTCGCTDADDARAMVRRWLSGGASVGDIQRRYRSIYGASAISIPSDEGLDRALWLVPVAAIAIAAGALVWLGRRWAKRGAAAAAAGASAKRATIDPERDAEIDAKLEEELDELDDR